MLNVKVLYDIIYLFPKVICFNIYIYRDTQHIEMIYIVCTKEKERRR